MSERPLCGYRFCLNRLPEDAQPNQKYCRSKCQKRADYYKHREKRQEAARLAYARDPEPHKASSKAYYEKNKEAVKARVRNRNAMLKRIKESRQRERRRVR